MKPIRVVVADDHSLVRAGIRLLIEEIEGVQVVGEAGTGDEALRLIRKLQPDVVLLDIKMPGPNGLEVLKKTAEESPTVRVIILTVHDEEQYVAQALRAGAFGYLPKSAASNELELAIKTVAEGGTYVSPELESTAALDRTRVPEQGHPITLTPRQQEVLKMIAEGHSTKDIALTLNISAKTVESHRAHLMDRLGIYEIAGLVRYAIKMGLVDIDR